MLSESFILFNFKLKDYELLLKELLRALIEKLLWSLSSQEKPNELEFYLSYFLSVGTFISILFWEKRGLTAVKIGFYVMKCND